jgi:hypothetical protein
MVVPPMAAQITAKRVAAEECAGNGGRGRRARRFHAGRAKILSSGLAVLRSISPR